MKQQLYHQPLLWVISVFMLLSSNLQAQDSLVYQLDKICKCYEKNADKKAQAIDTEPLQECINKNIYKNLKRRKVADSSHVWNEDPARWWSEHAMDAFNEGNRFYAQVEHIFLILFHQCDCYFDDFEKQKDGIIYHLKDEASTQIDSLTSRINEDETNELDYWNRGIRYLSLDKVSLAKDDLQKCLELNPGAIHANFFLGMVYERLGEYKEAEDQYEVAYNGSEKFLIRMYLESARKKVSDQ